MLVLPAAPDPVRTVPAAPASPGPMAEMKSRRLAWLSASLRGLKGIRCIALGTSAPGGTAFGGVGGDPLRGFALDDAGDDEVALIRVEARAHVAQGLGLAQGAVELHPGEGDIVEAIG